MSKRDVLPYQHMTLNQWRLVTFGLDSAAEPKSKYLPTYIV
jgi:hypothetical protein